jgi:hypothetical protein
MEKGHTEMPTGVVMEIAPILLFTSTGTAHKHLFDAKDIFTVMFVSIMCGMELFPQWQCDTGAGIDGRCLAM